nr:uncharacterized mitochondrial protein AtMg00810-like [Tanacetum cinerariifolium]
DAKTLIEAIEKWFGGNKETKKVQKTLLKQQYKNFTGLSSESLDQIHDRLQKLFSQLEILGESLSQEDINLKFLRSVPIEWRTHTLIWRNKIDLEEQSLDDLFNSLKIYEYDSVGSYDGSFQAEEEPTNYALMTFTSSSSSSSDNELSTTKPNKDLSYGPSAPIIKDWVSDLKDEYEVEPLKNALSFAQTTEQVKIPRPSVKPVEHSIPASNHKTDIPKPKSHGNNKNIKPCFICRSLTHMIKDCDYYEKKLAQTPVRNHAQKGNHQPYARMTHLNPQRHVVPTVVLTKSKLVPLTAARPVPTAVLQPHVTRPRPAKTIFIKPHSSPRRNINRRPSPKPSKFPPKVTTIKAPKVNVVKGVQGNWVNPQHALKDKGFIDSRCSRHMIGNMSYQSDFEAINGGYVTFGGNPKDTKCIVLSPEFKHPDENQVLLRVPKENNIYNVDLKNIAPLKDLTCLFAKETLDESYLWHRRLSHINFKIMNKLVKGNLVRGLPSKVFKNNHTCVACKKGKQHRASCKTKHVSSVSQPLQRSDNGTEFKNQDLNQFCGMKGINREYSVPRTPQQNQIAKRKNRTLIEAARTMLADSLLPISFLAEAVNTSCYVQNRVLVTKPHNKTHYELLIGKTPSIGFMRPFGCVVTILNTLDPLGKFDGKADKGFLVGYSILRTLMEMLPLKLRSLFKVKESEFEVEKPKFKVHVSSSSSAQTKKHGEKTKREAKGKSPVELSTGYRNLSAEFEDFFDNSINEVNVAGTSVPTVRQISTNNTNTFSTAGPSNTAVSPTHGKSSYMDPFQYPNDPNMPALEDITYSDDEEDVATQARSMTRVVKDQGGLTQINNEDFYTCMFACFLSQEKPKRVYQALKDLSWIEAMQEELLQFKMQKVWVLVDFPNGKRAIGFKDPDYLDKVYKVGKALYGLHQDPRAWYETLANYLLENDFQKGKIDQTLFNKKQKALLKDPDGEDVDVHTYRSMIGSLMYLTLSREDIMFAVYAYAHFQVTPKASHLHAVKRIFGYLKGKPHLGFWYPKDSPFNSVAYSGSDYAGASLDRKSTTGGCQFLGCRLIFWQCKKQTVVATLSTEAEYVAAASCCAQVLWIQNQLLDYGKKVIIMEAIVREALRLDDAESIDCLPNKEIFTKLSRMGYEKPSTKLTFYKAFFLAQWKFLIHTILQCMSSKRTSWNEFSYSMALAVICLSTGRKFNFSKAQVGDLSSHTTKYSSPSLTQKVFSNMRRVGKGFFGVETPLFESMIVAHQADDVVNEVVAELPSTSHVIPTPPPSPMAEPSSPSQPTLDAAISLDLLHTLLETCTTLTRKVKDLEQDKMAQAFEIIKLKQRVKKLDRKNKLKVSGLRTLRKDVTLKDVDDDKVEENAYVQGRPEESQAQIYKIDLEHADKVLSMQDDELEPAELKEVVEVVTTAKLMTEVVTDVVATITAAATPITVATITDAPGAVRRRKGVVIRDLKETATSSIIIDSEPKSKDNGKWIMVEEPCGGGCDCGRGDCGGYQLLEQQHHQHHFEPAPLHHLVPQEYMSNLELLSTFLTKLSKMYLEKMNLRPVDKQITAEAMAELKSFQDVCLALSDCRM